jgi:hypothetical protein
MRKTAVALGCLVLAVALAIVATVVVVDVRNPRDETAYLGYLKQYGSTRGTRIDLPPARSLIAEGDHACNWLGDAPTALWRTARSYRSPAVLARYRHAVRGDALPWGGKAPTRTTIAVAAWAELCPGTWVLHKPHYVFTQPNPGD